MPSAVDKLKIVHYPAGVLRRKASPVPEVTDDIRAIASRMLELMHEAPGVGLAAPQVGLGLRLFVASETGEPEDDMVFINPVILQPTEEMEDMEEGCLSLPEIRGQVRRPRGVTIQAIDLRGEPFSLRSEELPARIWQHETDHLDGVLIIDRMTPMERRANQKQLRQLEKDGSS